MLADGDIERLGEGEALVIDRWLPGEDALRARAAAEALFVAGQLRPAGIGRGDRRQLDPRIRGDEFMWLERDEVPSGMGTLLDAFEALRQDINQRAFAGLRSFEVQVACYSGGAGYARHRDAFRGEVNRRLTAICYLNPDWRADHGGTLRIWPPSGEALIAPILGRLVLFRADLLEHEVLPSLSPRYAVTAWFR